LDSPSPSRIYPLSLHDALPIYHIVTREQAPHSAALFASSILALAEASAAPPAGFGRPQHTADFSQAASIILRHVPSQTMKKIDRSEEHTSELQSHLNLVCRLLL